MDVYEYGFGNSILFLNGYDFFGLYNFIGFFIYLRTLTIIVRIQSLVSILENHIEILQVFICIQWTHEYLFNQILFFENVGEILLLQFKETRCRIFLFQNSTLIFLFCLFLFSFVEFDFCLV